MTATDATSAIAGHDDFDYRDPVGWSDYFGSASRTFLFGDATAGPLAFLSASPPMDEQMPTAFAHAHASDNWRISVRGTTDMGRESFHHGQFRFHDGGAPYAGDNLAWGPDGGFGLIVFGDRRGFAIEPVKQSIRERVHPEQVAAGTALGIEMLSPCPGAPAIRTSMGATQRSHQNGGFDESHDWPELTDGVRVFLGVFGEPERGPVAYLVDAEAGCTALPARHLGCETLIVPVGGSVSAGDDVLEQGSIRFEHADHPAPELVAGADGVQLVALVGDRRSLRTALHDGRFGDTDVAVALIEHLGELSASLTA